MYSIFVDEEGHHRPVIDGVIQPKPGLGIPESELKEEPRSSFLALANKVARENAQILRFLAKH